MREEDGQGFNFDKQRKEVGLGEDESRNKAKKSGKPLSVDPPNPSAFFEQYNNTLQKNREIQWLNGERESPDLKVKKQNAPQKQHQLPPFWKQQGNNQQHLPSVIQPTQVKYEVTTVVTATANGREQQPKQNSGIQVGMKMFNTLMGQSKEAPVQTPKKESVAAVGSKEDGDESSNSTPRFNEARSDKQINLHAINEGVSKGLSGSAMHGSSPLSRLSSLNQPPKTSTNQTNISNVSGPVNIFMGSSTATNNSLINRSNVAGFNKQGFIGQASKFPNRNQQSLLSPFTFSTMKTVKLFEKKNGSAEAARSVGYRRLVQRCIRYRQKIREMLKSSAGGRQKLIDIVALLTIDHPKPLERELIIKKADCVVSLYEQIQESKRKGRRSDNFIKVEDQIDDTFFTGFNLNNYLAHSEGFVVKKIAEVPQEKMNQIKSLPKIQKFYRQVENMSGEQFAHKFSDMIENIKGQMVAQIEKCVLLLNSKRQAEALALRCEQEQEKLKSKSKAVQQQLVKIQDKQRYCRQFFAECCRYLQVQSPQQLPKQEINYHWDCLNELSVSALRMKGQLKRMRKLLEKTSEGEPHRTITSKFCSLSNTLVELLHQLQGLGEPV